jgi:hypothetical protein
VGLGFECPNMQRSPFGFKSQYATNTEPVGQAVRSCSIRIVRVPDEESRLRRGMLAALQERQQVGVDLLRVSCWHAVR